MPGTTKVDLLGIISLGLVKETACPNGFYARYQKLNVTTWFERKNLDESLMTDPLVQWLCFDEKNGSPWDLRGYVWGFDTQKEARDHRRMQNKDPRCADLTKPYKYNVASNWIGNRVCIRTRR